MSDLRKLRDNVISARFRYGTQCYTDGANGESTSEMTLAAAAEHEKALDVLTDAIRAEYTVVLATHDGERKAWAHTRQQLEGDLQDALNGNTRRTRCTSAARSRK